MDDVLRGPRGSFRCVQDYRKLRVHANANSLAIRVRGATIRFPRTGYASFKSQLTSAAESIAFNIVEGCGANSPREFARFLDIGIKSAIELEYQLALAKDYGVLRYSVWETLTVETIDVRKMLFGLRARVLAKAHPLGRNATTENTKTDNA